MVWILIKGKTMKQNYITISTMKPLRRGKKGMGLNSLDSVYIANGHYPLIDDTPEYDPSLQTISNELVIDETNKVVNRVYTVTNMTPEELIVVENNLLANLRDQRDRLLAETDFYALSDVTMTADMTTYRQALRDLPANTADVFNPVYPTKPE
jgi:hypothetical protein